MILPAMSWTGDTDDRSTSEMRVDFSSMVLINRPCVMEKIEIQRMYTKTIGAFCRSRSRMPKGACSPDSVTVRSVNSVDVPSQAAV